MRVREIAIPTPEGPMQALFALPDGEGPFVPVISYAHVGGLSDTMRLMVAVVAEGGYASIIPDPYHRLGRIVLDAQSTNPEAIAIKQIAVRSVTAEGAMADTSAVLDWIATRSYLRHDACPVIGYGRGGGLALRALAEFHPRIPCAASLLGMAFEEYGVDLARMRGEIYAAFAENDAVIPPAVPAALRQVLQGYSDRWEVAIHPGMRHPYLFPDRAVYDAAASARDWRAVFTMFARCVPQPLREVTGSD